MSRDADVRAILGKVLGADVDLSNARLGQTPEWDSLASLSILLELEEKFDVEFSNEDIEGLIDVASIVVTLDRLLHPQS
jgi:acyl carrier protein